jgi:hypothetical protein
MGIAAVGILILVQAVAGQQESGKSNGVPIAGTPGVVLKDGIAGTPEGHAICELQYWISWEDYDLAEAAYRLGCREINSPRLRFVRSWSLLKWAVAKKKGFDRAVAALEEVQATDHALREHVAALVKSVRAVMPCVGCEGRGRIRCIRCHGRGEIGGDPSEPCGVCENGERRCLSCDGPRKAPALGDICIDSPCALCEGRGVAFKAVRFPCGECRGLGRKLAPKADPGKKLP